MSDEARFAAIEARLATIETRLDATATREDIQKLKVWVLTGGGIVGVVTAAITWTIRAFSLP